MLRGNCCTIPSSTFFSCWERNLLLQPIWTKYSDTHLSKPKMLDWKARQGNYTHNREVHIHAGFRIGLLCLSGICFNLHLEKEQNLQKKPKSDKLAFGKKKKKWNLIKSSTALGNLQIEQRKHTMVLNSHKTGSFCSPLTALHLCLKP